MCHLPRGRWYLVRRSRIAAGGSRWLLALASSSPVSCLFENLKRRSTKRTKAINDGVLEQQRFPFLRDSSSHPPRPARAVALSSFPGCTTEASPISRSRGAYLSSLAVRSLDLRYRPALSAERPWHVRGELATPLTSLLDIQGNETCSQIDPPRGHMIGSSMLAVTCCEVIGYLLLVPPLVWSAIGSSRRPPKAGSRSNGVRERNARAVALGRCATS